MSIGIIISIIGGILGIIVSLLNIRKRLRENRNPISVHTFESGVLNDDVHRAYITVKVTNGSNKQLEITSAHYMYGTIKRDEGPECRSVRTASKLDDDGFPIADGYLQGTTIAPGSVVEGVIVEDFPDHVLKGTYIAEDDHGEEWEYINEDVVPHKMRRIEIFTVNDHKVITEFEVPEDMAQAEE